MRILLILLIAGLCLVTAKYIPLDSNDASQVIHRVRRSDSKESDSNTASVERDDDLSNDNDKDDEDNDSAERSNNEEKNKLSEKEEKKQQKLREKLEKEKQKEIEEKRKLEEKLAKELQKQQEKREKEERKLQEKKEKEERKLQEKLEKEKHKLEEQKRKAEEKLEKEEKKRQEKLAKQLEELQKEQKESAEDTYLETEEEDSVEMEDIWKAHVYDKYGISITSTKLERQAALQRYLREEMGIDANSTKSERRQAILNLIQTKLQNDSVAVDSFRNLLLSHVNAAQIQKLKTKLENDLEELNNQTELLNNISLPWATVAQQNIEEKRTFLQAIAQFLSNIIPNWLTGGQPSNNPSQLNGDGLPGNTATSSNSGTTDTGTAIQPSQAASTDNNVSSNNDVVGSESNLTVLPSTIGTVSSLNNPSESNGSLDNISLNNNILIGQINLNGVPTPTGYPGQGSPELPSSNPAESNGPIGSGTNNGVAVQATVNRQATADVNAAANSGLTEPAGSANLKPTPSNTLQETESMGSASSNINDPVSQTNVNELPSNIDGLVNIALPNSPAGIASESSLDNTSGPIGSVGSDVLNNNVPVSQTNVNGLPADVNNVAAVNSVSNVVATASEPSAANPSEPNEPVESISLDNNVHNNATVSEINVNDLPSNVDNSASVVSSNTPISESAVGNPSDLTGTESGGVLNNGGLVNPIDVNGLPSNANVSANINPSDTPAVDASGSNQGNVLELNRPVENVSLDNNTPVSQISENELPLNVGNTADIDSLNTQAPQTNQEKPSETNEPIESVSLNNHAPVSQTSVNGLPSNLDTSANVNSARTPVSELTSANPSDGSISEGSGALNNNDLDIQIQVNGLPSNVDNVANINSQDTPGQATSDLASGNPETNGAVENVILDNNVPVSQISENGLPSNVDNSVNVDLQNTSTSESTSNNPTISNSLVGDVSLNDAPVSQTSVGGLTSNMDNSANTNLPNAPASEITPSNPSESNGSVGSVPVDNNGPVSDAVVIPINPTNMDSLNPTTEADTESITSNPSDSNGSIIISNVLAASNSNSSNISDQAASNPLQPNEVSNNVSLAENGVLTNVMTLENSNLDVLDNSSSANQVPSDQSDVALNTSEIVPSSSLTSNDINSSTDKPSEQLSGDSSSFTVSGINDSSVSDVTVETRVENNDNAALISKNVEPTESTVSNDISNITSPNLYDETPVTSNVEEVTGVPSQNSNSGDKVEPNTEAGVIVENTDALTTPVAETNYVVTDTESQTEQGNLLVEEIVNTPNDIVTVASIEASSPIPPPNITIPDEPAASVIDINVQ